MNGDVKSIFGKALAFASADERAGYLDQACGEDSELRREVEELLQAHGRAGDFLKQAPDSPGHTIGFPSEQPGTAIGPYVLREQIGEGGFGVVYVAEQKKPVVRKVALKIIKPGMDTRDIIARFEAERQALALMDHPNIAKVLDAGATESGRPYFVMELVKGVPITAFCDEQKLPTRERLQIFVDVCRAVQHAHQKGIIHRDLKPSNIMVTMSDGRPIAKVIDFGVSKALSRKLTEKTVYTAYGQLVGTPLYMSPEQAAMSMHDVDTRSDVYSLGVLLYELLTGTTPFDKEILKKADFDELRRIIREDEPPRPSARISTLNAEALSTVSDKRQIDPRKLSQSMRGELDWIVMKALEKDRQRRYESVSDLAADVECHLNDEPVHACPPSLWYQFRKFARRRKASLVGVAVVVLFLVLLGGGIGWVSRDRAEQRAKAEYAVKLALTESEDLQKNQRWEEALRVVRRANESKNINLASDELRNRLRSRLADLKLIAKLEKILLDRFNSSNANKQSTIGLDHSKAERDFVEAFRQFKLDVFEMTPSEAAKRIQATSVATELVLALYNWARRRKLRHKDDPDSAKHLMAVALAADADQLRKQLYEAEARKDTKRLRELYANLSLADLSPQMLYELSLNFWHSGEKEESISILRRAREIHPGDFMINWRLGHALPHTPENFEEVLHCFLIARALRPRSSTLHVQLGRQYYNGARYVKAIQYLKRAIELQSDCAVAFFDLGKVYQKQGKLRKAVTAYQKALQHENDYPEVYYELGRAFQALGTFDQAAEAYKQTVSLQSDHYRAWFDLGDVYGKQSKLKQAVNAYLEASRHKNKFSHARWHSRLAQSFFRLGENYRKQGKLKEALAQYRNAVDHKTDDPVAHCYLGNALQELGSYVEAIAAYKNAVKLKKDYFGAWYNLGNVLKKQGKLQESEDAFKKAIHWNKEFAQAHCNLGHLYRIQGRFTEALVTLKRGHKLSANQPGWSYPSARWVRECEKLVEVQAYLQKRGAMLTYDKDGLAVQGSMKLSDQKLVKGQLTKDSPLLNKKHHAIQKLEIKSDSIYFVDLISTEFDPFLLLTNATGKVLAHDDDGGEGLNSRLIVIGEKQTQHEIVATTFQPGTTGNYTLRIREYTLTGKGKKADSKKEK